MVRRVGDSVPLRMNNNGKVYYTDRLLELELVTNKIDSVVPFDMRGKPNRIKHSEGLIHTAIVLMGYIVWISLGITLSGKTAELWLGIVMVSLPVGWIIISATVLGPLVSRLIYALKIVEREEVEATVVNKEYYFSSGKKGKSYHKVYFTSNGLWGMIDNLRLYDWVEIGSLVVVERVQDRYGEWYLAELGYRG